MGCGMGLIKYLLFIFNFIFALCGLAILVVGVLANIESNSYEEAVKQGLKVPALTLIIVGSIIFVIAFFGCCGAIRESHCMTITFAAFLLTLLIVQIAIAIYVFVAFKESNIDIKDSYTELFKHYWTSESEQQAINVIQSNFQCCGIDSYKDYSKYNMNSTIPMSCCANNLPNGEKCNPDYVYEIGCATLLKKLIIKTGTVLGGVALGIAAVEFIGIVFSLCLANSIKETDRRHYRV